MNEEIDEQVMLSFFGDQLSAVSLPIGLIETLRSFAMQMKAGG